MDLLHQIASDIGQRLTFMAGRTSQNTEGWRCFFPMDKVGIIKHTKPQGHIYDVGSGTTIQAAADDYLSRLVGQTLIITKPSGQEWPYTVTGEPTPKE